MNQQFITTVNPFGLSNKLFDREDTDDNILFELFGNHSDDVFDFYDQWEDEKRQAEIVDFYCNYTK